MTDSDDLGFDDPTFDWDSLIALARQTTERDAFADAWLSADPSTAGGRLSRQALEVSAADSIDLTAALNDLTGAQDRLEIRLDGPGVVGHSASAEKLGVFMKAVSRVVRDIAKSRTGRLRLRDNLLASALAPGSVIVRFDVRPDPPLPREIRGARTERVENFAVRDFASLLLQAEDAESTVLDASVHNLRGTARTSLRAVARVVSDSGWELSGTLTQVDGERVPVELSFRGAHRILDATKQSQQEINEVDREGVVDAWSWSRQTMRLEFSESDGIDAYVPPALAQRVAALNAQHESVVDARFEELVTYPTGDPGTSRRSYTLIAIQEQPDQQTLGE